MRMCYSDKEIPILKRSKIQLPTMLDKKPLLHYVNPDSNKPKVKTNLFKGIRET